MIFVLMLLFLFSAVISILALRKKTLTSFYQFSAGLGKLIKDWNNLRESVHIKLDETKSG